MAPDDGPDRAAQTDDSPEDIGVPTSSRAAGAREDEPPLSERADPEFPMYLVEDLGKEELRQRKENRI